MTPLEEARERAPRKSPWRFTDGKQYTVVEHRMSGDRVDVVYSLTTDCRVQLAMPIADFLSSFARVP